MERGPVQVEPMEPGLEQVVATPLLVASPGASDAGRRAVPPGVDACAQRECLQAAPGARGQVLADTGRRPAAEAATSTPRASKARATAAPAGPSPTIATATRTRATGSADRRPLEPLRLDVDVPVLDDEAELIPAIDHVEPAPRVGVGVRVSVRADGWGRTRHPVGQSAAADDLVRPLGGPPTRRRRRGSRPARAAPCWPSTRRPPGPP